MNLISDINESNETDKSVEQAEDLALAVDTDYQALTPREEADLESLMSQCEFAISNAEAFAEQLQGELSVLDGVNFINLHSLTEFSLLESVRHPHWESSDSLQFVPDFTETPLCPIFR